MGANDNSVELFVSDIHGEYESFSHVIRSGCGTVRRAIDQLFPSWPQEQRAQLATLVYYPQEKLPLLLEQHEADAQEWRLQAAEALRGLCAFFAGEEPGTPGPDSSDDASDDGIVALACKVRRLTVSRLHMLGDVFDRGPRPDLVMESLMNFHSLDIQWGNHDVLWMGAAMGQPGSVANVVRICARYANLGILESIYGIDLSSLRAFAAEAYRDDPCKLFAPKGNPALSDEQIEQLKKIHKAMTILQFKVEARLINDNPSFGLADRNLLHLIDYENKTIVVDGIKYELLDTYFPTVDKSDPYRLTSQEEQVIQDLCSEFEGCGKLRRHIEFLVMAGSMYKVCGDDLLYHACVPLNPDGTFMEANIYGKSLSGKALYDAVDNYVRDAYGATDPKERRRGRDLLWYLWLAPSSPLFAKSKMATFELYFIADKAARVEVRNPYFAMLNDPKVVRSILSEFGVDPQAGRLLFGHVPVKVKDGEDPVKAGGHALLIDGGFSKAYLPTTGIAGICVVNRKDGSELDMLEPFEGRAAAIANDADLRIQRRML